METNTIPPCEECRRPLSRSGDGHPAPGDAFVCALCFRAYMLDDYYQLRHIDLATLTEPTYTAMVELLHRLRLAQAKLKNLATS